MWLKKRTTKKKGFFISLEFFAVQKAAQIKENLTDLLRCVRGNVSKKNMGATIQALVVVALVYPFSTHSFFFILVVPSSFLIK